MTWYSSADNWPRHQKKEIHEALRIAKRSGWRLKTSNGHIWGAIYCPIESHTCRFNIYGTPQNPSETRTKLLRTLKGCERVQSVGD